VDILVFLSALVDALAWPAFLFGMALIFKRPISERVKHVRKVVGPGGSEVEFDRGLQEVRKETEQVPELQSSEKRAIEINHSPLIDLGPFAYVVERWAFLDSLTRSAAFGQGIGTAYKMPIEYLLGVMQSKGYISEQLAHSALRLKSLRDVMVARSLPVTQEQALSYGEEALDVGEAFVNLRRALSSWFDQESPCGAAQ